tara:strand:+ start:1177 stop:1731 length:555 start_codon:yes stop_codon:yes gene_type:complete
MAIEIQIGSPAVAEEEKPVQATMALNVRKSLDGNIMIFDHEEIDVVVMPSKNKVVAFPKDMMSDTVYEAQDRLFFYLVKNGIVTPESVHGGNVYGSLEGAIAKPLEEGVDQSQVAVFSIGKFVMEEKPFFNTQKEYEEDVEDGLTNPDEEESTELGDVDHKEMQGSLRPGFLRGAYGLNYMYRY